MKIIRFEAEASRMASTVSSSIEPRDRNASIQKVPHHYAEETGSGEARRMRCIPVCRTNCLQGSAKQFYRVATRHVRISQVYQETLSNKKKFEERQIKLSFCDDIPTELIQTREQTNVHNIMHYMS